MPFAIFNQPLVTDIGFIGPVVLIEDSSFRFFIDLTLKTNNKSFVLLAINFFSIYKLKSLKRDDYSVDF